MPVKVTASPAVFATEFARMAASLREIGATAAKIRSFRPVNKDPYGLKGVKYTAERPRQKEGKSGAK